VSLLRAGTVYDCGYPLNPALCAGQVEGSVSMAQGQALTEAVMLEGGQIINPSFGTYALPDALNASGSWVEFVNSFEPRGPFGAKEIGEGAVAGIMAAIANAVFDAVGSRVTSLPITPEKALRGMANGVDLAVYPELRPLQA
ncbi:MAG TPA: molybdopterin cofactor-binding domain-containing protein, partial [Dehalococcoidia bacterium]|nr:molybdopterin cofactor-binding domain-containing protein [Dehalococcoidia bacterium]